MSTIEKKLKVVSWEEVKEMFPKENVHHELIDVLDTICTSLKKIQQDYFYLAEFEFGDYLINKGKIAFSTPKLISDDFNISEIHFDHDLSYSTDPLGFILEGNLEIYFENKSNQTHIYKVPISTLTNGNFFGTYGTLDNQFNIEFQSNLRDWYVVSGSGNNIFVATSFHTEADSNLLGDLNSEFKKEKRKINAGKWSKFLNQFTDAKDKVKIVYFPKHIIDKLFINKNNPLIQIAWKQTLGLRSNFLKENSITNFITNHNIKFKNKELFITELYEYLLSAINGNSECLIPIMKENHIINKAFEKFNSSSSKKISYVAFEYGKIESSSFGILLLPLLPLFNNYKENGLKNLVYDLHEISTKQRETKNQIMNNIVGCTKKNQIADAILKKYVIEHSDFIKNYLLPLNYDFENANLGANEFSSFLIIKRK